MPEEPKMLIVTNQLLQKVITDEVFARNMEVMTYNEDGTRIVLIRTIYNSGIFQKGKQKFIDEIEKVMKGLRVRITDNQIICLDEPYIFELLPKIKGRTLWEKIRLIFGKK